MLAIETLLICVLQVTLVAAFGIALSVMMRRALKTSAGLPLVATLLSITLLTICSFNSWPSWFQQSSSSGVAVSSSGTVVPESKNSDVARLSSHTDPELDGNEGRNFDTTNDALSGVLAWVEYFSAAYTQPHEKTASNAWSFRGVTVLLFILCFCLGLIRLIGGLVGVHLFVRDSRALDNRELREQLELIQAELGYTRTIVVRESKALSLAATVGWRRPVILLSDSWRGWSETQLRSILAHEIAHIRRGDYVATMFAQFGLLLHFYHPLVHWLANRLRLEQELAADAIAAQFMGGSQVYLDAIGELALKQSSEPMGWPAHSFLPTRRTFLRRIEMLRDLKLLTGKGAGAVRWATSIGVLAVTLVAVGLRPPGTIAPTSDLLAQAPVKLAGDTPNATQDSPLIARYVPEVASAVAVLRPNVISITAEKMVASKLISAELLTPLGMIKEATQATVVFIQNAPAAAVCMTFNDKEARIRFEQASTPRNTTWEKTNLLLYQYEKSSDGRLGRFIPDEKTIIYGDKYVVETMILTTGKSLSQLTQTDAWNRASKGVLVAAVSGDGIGKLVEGPLKQNPVMTMFSPLWNVASSHVLAISMDDRLRMVLSSTGKDQAGTKSIETTIQAAMAMLSNMLNSLQNDANSNAQESTKALSSLLASHKLEVNGTETRLSLDTDLDGIAKLLVEPLAAMKSASDRSEQANNMKQVMLALHNYHGAYTRFPPSTIVDAQSGVKRSWRVEILPYLEQQELYNQYKKDEPWDSPANMKVLTQMPRAFRHPSQPGNSTNTAITAAYGDGLLFNRSNKGIQLTEVTDGTSNTVAILEVETEIPWTKPEDIEIDVTKDKLPEFGGFDATGYNVGFGDGSVSYFSKSIDVSLLKILLTIAGGEAIPQ